MIIGDISIPVVILRLDHHGALGIARSLGRLGVEVYGVHSSDSAPAFRSRYCRRGFVCDLDQPDTARSVDFLLDVARQIGGRAVLLPSNDETALFAADFSAQLQERFIFPSNPASLVRSLFEKKQMISLAMQLGIPTAETFPLESRNDAVNFCKSGRFPVLLKASDGISVFRRAGRKMVLIHTAEELLRNYDAMKDPQSQDLMLQEYIPGGEEGGWIFNGYFDEHSECLFGCTGKKIHQYPIYAGTTSLGVCLRNEAVDRLTRRFMKEIGYKGILDIDYYYDHRDGLYKVLDVNPRVGATFRLFEGQNGLDVVRAMYLHITGQNVPLSRICEGRKWIAEDLELTSLVHYLRDAALSVRDGVRSLRGIREAAWFASDDAKPFVDMCATMIARPFRKLAKKVNRQAVSKRLAKSRLI
jgi:predicted ATP-grasp superfamily ATP-dependent carboligase